MPLQTRALSLRECFALLRSTPVGRVVYTEHALPAVRPVNFSVHDNRVIIRTQRDSWAVKIDCAVVGFEIDQLDPDTETGWSVTVIGKARLVTDIDAWAELLDPSTCPYLRQPGEHILTIDTERVTGRRITATTTNRS